MLTIKCIKLALNYIMAKKDNEKREPSKLDEVLNRIKETKEKDVKLHFITRILRCGDLPGDRFLACG